MVAVAAVTAMKRRKMNLIIIVLIDNPYDRYHHQKFVIIVSGMTLQLFDNPIKCQIHAPLVQITYCLRLSFRHVKN